MTHGKELVGIYICLEAKAFIDDDFYQMEPSLNQSWEAFAQNGIH